MATKWETVTTYHTLHRAEWELVLNHLSAFPEAAQRIRETLDAAPENNVVSIAGSRKGWERIRKLIEGDEVLREVALVMRWQLYAAATIDW
jgi:hypothetical protein